MFCVDPCIFVVVPILICFQELSISQIYPNNIVDIRTVGFAENLSTNIFVYKRLYEIVILKLNNC